MPRRIKFDHVATGLMAACALVVTGFYVRRELRKPPDPSKPIYVKDWQKYEVGNMRIGPETARVVLIEFSDFQCPFCGRLSRSLMDLRAKYSHNLRVVYRNLPIPQLHPFARAAALNAYCAGELGNFEPLHDYYFSHVDSLGAESWGTMATKAGIADTLMLSSCAASARANESIAIDSAAAVELGVTGTPTILINGWRYPGAPSLPTLDSVITEMLAEPE